MAPNTSTRLGSQPRFSSTLLPPISLNEINGENGSSVASKDMLLKTDPHLFTRFREPDFNKCDTHDTNMNNYHSISLNDTPKRKKTNKKVNHADFGDEFSFSLKKLSREQEERMRASVYHLVSSSRGILDLTEDGKEFRDMLNSNTYRNTETCPEERHLNFYLRFGKQLANHVCGLLVTENMLDFEKARRILLFFAEMRIQIGAVLNAPIGCPCITEPKSEGLDNSERYIKLKELGVTFVLWQASFRATFTEPSTPALEANCRSIAKFAATAQQADLVPIVSIEMAVATGNGFKGLARQSLEKILTTLMFQLKQYGVFIEGMIIRLKIPKFEEGHLTIRTQLGHTYSREFTPCPQENEFTEEPRNMSISTKVFATATAISRTIPSFIGGIMLASECTLSESLQLLTEINRCPVQNWPFTVNFCFSRVLLEGIVENHKLRTMWPPRYLSSMNPHRYEQSMQCAGDILVKNIKNACICAIGEHPNNKGGMLWVRVVPLWTHSVNYQRALNCQSCCDEKH